MNFEGLPAQVRLRTNQALTIRLMELEDGPAVLRFFRALPEEDRLFLRDDVTSPVWLERFLEQVDYHTVIPLVAEHQNKVVANAALYRQRYGWSAHVGEIRVAVARAFQRKGLGTAMAHELVKMATGLGLEKLVVSVVDNQTGARRAFEKLGFRKEAVLRGQVKDVNGSRRDLVILANDVSHLWEAMDALMRDYLPSLE
jgi:RimJ/RimL family protein N-acetyltransferase